MFTLKLITGKEAVRFWIKTSTYVWFSVLTVQALCLGPELGAEFKTSLF